ncbi:MAG: ribonuclease III [Eubacterium sp.]|nr:ribonuclease III [Eubacterium sp.]
MDIYELESILGHSFANKALLDQALTHSSYCRENGLPAADSNERLEFIGDAVLDAAVGIELYRRLPEAGEGRLTKLRALVVCERSLALMAREMEIGSLLLMGNGEDKYGGREKDSIIADALEAVIGALFLDAGFQAAERFVSERFAELIDLAINGELYTDHKTKIQELLQAMKSNPVIRYIVDRENGPDHDKTFHVHLEVDGIRLGNGSGKTKKEAEQKAAEQSLNGGYLNNVL